MGTQQNIVCTNPTGYQRTSEALQFEYLSILVKRGRPSGAVLDVGCGTGNALRLLGRYGNFDYTGIDISPEMLNFARTQKHQASRFICADFLDQSTLLESEYDHVICAACLHWFHPKQENVIKKIKSILRPGGFLHLSTALSFTFLDEHKDIQTKAIEEVRSKFQPIAPMQLFEERRLSLVEIKNLCLGFDIYIVSLHEEKLNFQSFDDFFNWHTSSGSVLTMQFHQQDLLAASNMYYDLLYKLYLKGHYQVAYATALLNLIKVR